jgi:alkanesulfonate monooxygenase SsuD/methylene tetrahydromethanopterin reductase-like flavin-dependent oxidoreductase (luciferase family)
VFTPNFQTFADPLWVAHLASLAEASGWDGWFLWDHVVHRSGDEPTVDPWMTLGAMAMKTARIKLGPMITPLPRRRPWNVARQAVTLDQMSGGRAVLGVGIGASWGTPEFTGYGEEENLSERGVMLDEGLEVIEGLWSGEQMDHDGAHYRVQGVRFLPTPLQSPLPIWVAAVWPNKAPLRRAARFQGVFPLGLPGPEALVEVLAQVGEGKDIAVKAGEYPVSAWAEAGATWIIHEIDRDANRAEVVRLVEAGPNEGA